MIISLSLRRSGESNPSRIEKYHDTRYRVSSKDDCPQDPWATIWSDENWHTMTVTWDDTNNKFRVYLDGSERTRMNGTYDEDNFTLLGSFLLAARNTSHYCFEGGCGYVATFDDALDATTVMDYHTNGVPEPVTLVSLAPGGCALFRRRK